MNGLRDQQLHFRVSKQELERIWSKMESSGILSIARRVQGVQQGSCPGARESDD